MCPSVEMQGFSGVAQTRGIVPMERLFIAAAPFKANSGAAPKHDVPYLFSVR